MRIFKCNRCGTTFNSQGEYIIMRKASQTASGTPPVYTTTPAAWIDLCPTCTTAFYNWLHPNQENKGGDSDE